MSLRPKQRSAYWRGEKIVVFFKRSIIVLSIFIFIAIAALGVKMSARAFPVKNIIVSGNYHLEEDEVKEAVNIREGESLLRLSFDELETRIKHMAWIKKVVFRRQFPGTLMIRIEEAVPKALLRLKKHMFLIDTGGNVLEEIGNKSIPFLPVIVGINPEKDRGGILEALKLIDALNEKNILSGGESIEIMLKPYGLAMNMDGEFVKVGYGEYPEKLERWKELEAEIRKRNIAINYIDLRFKDSVIVKPLRVAKKGKSKNVK